MSIPNQPTVIHNYEANRFETSIDGHTGYISYQVDKNNDNTLIYDHTIVPRELGGQGIGSVLVKHALDYAKKENKTVIPECSFVAHYISKHPAYEFLVKK